MSFKSSVGYVVVRVFAHATEDEEKVLTAVRNILPEEAHAEADLQKKCLAGHHGNPILLLETKLRAKHLLPSLLEKMAQGLSALDKQTLESNIKSHIEKHNLYMRFDKQAAYQGRIRLSNYDPIHFKIHFKNKSPKEIIEICRDVGLLS